MVRPFARLRADLLILAIALTLLPIAANAKEESKIQIRLSDLSANANANGNGNGLGRGGVRAAVRTHLQGKRATLKLQARGLDAHTEYVLLCKDAESGPASAELARFTTSASGSATKTQNLAKTDDPNAPTDPRGKFLVIADAADESVEIVGGWLYGDPQDDGPKTKVKELTQLAPDAASDPSGRVDARYDMRPNGHGKLSIAMRGVPAGDYDVLVDGIAVATLTPNRGGNAKADFQTRPMRGKGKSKGKARSHRKKQQLDFDPRRKDILIQLSDATPMFAGPMIAQIEGLNACSPDAVESPLAGAAGAGTAALEVEANCETAFDVEVVDVPAGSYDVYVDDALVATLDAADDGSGTVTGFVRFDPTPDAGEDEALLDFAVGSSSLVELFDAGADPAVDVPVLSGSLL